VVALNGKKMGEVYKHMKWWVDRVNQPQKDFWIETPWGKFKNLKLKTNDELDDIGEITITMQYDGWDKQLDDE
jgi:hypothetical protein